MKPTPLPSASCRTTRRRAQGLPRAVERGEGGGGIVAIGRVQGIVGVVPVGGIEGIIRREGLRGILRIVRRILTGWIEDIVVALVFLIEVLLRSAKEGVTTRSKAIRI